MSLELVGWTKAGIDAICAKPYGGSARRFTQHYRQYFANQAELASEHPLKANDLLNESAWAHEKHALS